ncbi:MAG: glycosyltransferase family 2 protein [Blastochloris sp.]|nr:glycosyltransferase family 2 protein [Blastochloris sp.]
MAELMIVLPVYNEQASVRKVVLEWFQEIENWTEDFTFLAINDGSKDGTLAILERLKEQLGSRLEILNQENQGHGQSCLKGYRLAYERGVPWVMQIDSDGQCDPQYFFRLWRQRSKCEVIYGVRSRRDDGWRRSLASMVLKVVLLLWGGVYCVDANVPYRLMKTEKLGQILERIPRDFFLANVGLAVLLRRAGWSQGTVPIHFRERYGGEPSVTLGKFGTKAFELVRQIKLL